MEDIANMQENDEYSLGLHNNFASSRIKSILLFSFQSKTLRASSLTVRLNGVFEL